MVKTSVYLPWDLQQELRSLARRTGRPQAELLRDAVRRYVDEQPAELPSSIGIASSGGLHARDAKAWVHAEWDRKPAERLAARRQSPTE